MCTIAYLTSCDLEKLQPSAVDLINKPTSRWKPKRTKIQSVTELSLVCIICSLLQSTCFFLSEGLICFSSLIFVWPYSFKRWPPWTCPHQFAHCLLKVPLSFPSACVLQQHARAALGQGTTSQAILLGNDVVTGLTQRLFHFSWRIACSWVIDVNVVVGCQIPL